MRRLLSLAWLTAMAMLPIPGAALAGHAEYDALVAKHARANAVPEVLVHRVIVRESRYRPELVGRGGTIGLMQIKLATARGLGYAGDAAGLRDPDTNLLYGVKYLAGAYRVANGDHDRAVHYFASGYYYQAKQQRLERVRIERHAGPVLASAPPKEAMKIEEAAPPVESAMPEEMAVAPVETATEPTAPAVIIKPHHAAAKRHKHARKNFTEAEARVPRPPAGVPAGANAPKAR